MNLKLIALNIKQFCPGLSIPVIKQRINVRYRQILEQEDWLFLNDSEVVTLPERVENTSTESCGATFGSTTVSGTGTSWTSAIEGKFFRVNDDAQFYRVSSVTNTTTLILEKTYAQDTVTGKDFEYWNEKYSPTSSEIARISSVAYQTELVEKSQDYFQRLDPERSSTGSPVYYSVVNRASESGVTSFDIWPVPDDNYGVRVYYKKTVDLLTSNSSEPVFDSALLEAAALWDCYRLSFGTTQNPAFMGLARDAMLEYQRMLRDTIIQDLNSTSLPGGVRDVVNRYGSEFYNNVYALDHDVY
jgi:hypothetical protein